MTGWGSPSIPVNWTITSEKKPPVRKPMTAAAMPHMSISRMSWPKPPLGRTLNWMTAQAMARMRP